MNEREFYDEICLAREFMGSTKTTPAQWDAIIKRLGMLAFGNEVPERLRYIAVSQVIEAAQRRMYVDMRSIGTRP